MRPIAISLVLVFLAAIRVQAEDGRPARPKVNTQEHLAATVAGLAKEVRTLRTRLSAIEGATTFDDNDIKILEDLVAARAKLHKHVSDLQKARVRGGEADREAQARYYLAIAKARLALAKGDSEGRHTELEAAVAAAKTWVEAAEATLGFGTVTTELLIEAQSHYAEARLQLNRIERQRAAEQEEKEE
jgi:hypothetical protein